MGIETRVEQYAGQRASGTVAETDTRPQNAEKLPVPAVTPIVEGAPDGGLTAWLQVVGGHLVVFNVWGYTNSFGIFQSYYASSLSLPPSTISWIGSMQVFCIFAMGTFSGRAFDAGYYLPLLMAGSSLQLLSIFMTSISSTYWQLFLAQGLCQGLGNGLIFAPTVAHVATYFSRRRSLAISTAASGAATGGVVFPLIAQQLLPRIGFGWTMRIMGFVVLANVVIILVVMKVRLEPRKSGPFVELAAFKELPYLLFSISMFFTLWATYFAYYYVRPYAGNIPGVSDSTSFTILLIVNGVGIPGRLVPAYLADRYFGTLNVLIPTIFLCAVCLYLWATVHNLTEDYVWVVFFGLFGAGIQGMFPSSLAGLTSDPSKNGTRIGMVFTIVSTACLTGPPLAGRLIQAAGGNYIGAQTWGGSCLVLGGLILVAAKVASRHEKEDET
ncbi:major facilitator superfamily domain-containing protein [Xylariales sp. PMI_506]|nr:major facilitator superfamily domain-containing protein [Xylariales sp. PMI_506]